MDTKTVLKEALHLRPAERRQFVEYLIQSLNKPDEEVDKVWAEEVEKRYKAYKAGKVKAHDLKKVSEKYK